MMITQTQHAQNKSEGLIKGKGKRLKIIETTLVIKVLVPVRKTKSYFTFIFGKMKSLGRSFSPGICPGKATWINDALKEMFDEVTYHTSPDLFLMSSMLMS